MPQWRTAVLTGSTTPAVTVNLHLDLTTLMGLNDRPGHLPGWGPVLADIARHLAADHPATWRWRLTDTDHELIHTGKTTARPAASLLAHIRDRDITCRFPGCRTPATRSDIDHTIARTEGGGHHPDNLGALCRRHHRAKHEGGWQLSQPKPGHFIWTSPHGRTYTVTPDHAIPP